MCLMLLLVVFLDYCGGTINVVFLVVVVVVVLMVFDKGGCDFGGSDSVGRDASGDCNVVITIDKPLK